MAEKEQLILDLRRIAENNYELSAGEEPRTYISRMFKYIGDPDPELRDDLIYSTFYMWIGEKEFFSEAEQKDMLDTLISENYLLYRFGNMGDETVFTRTFSILVIVLILARHRKKSFLSMDSFLKVKNTLIRYYQEERDLRGYIEDYGWAHGAAHGADAMDELAQCEESDEVILQEVLGAMQKVLYNEKFLLSNEEDERMARVVYRMIKTNRISREMITQWIEGLSQCCEWERTRSQYIARVNTKNFVRCLYFKLLHNEIPGYYPDILCRVEAMLNRFFEVDKCI
ncbi:MAG: hypothetical protein K0R93_372 [Anaerosolibacter sp.]|uniref:DUF2785 domain-containing protein n=1 Tax=Anaerosolibacter sp. TaxID=1872527 RepID=UPI00260476A0|nr:DUF2785 domain-containing protein [Anaerosolibacter sp.]MDF2545474.1 hypothetical protein [Anaerosolibacter sp.]